MAAVENIGNRYTVASGKGWNITRNEWQEGKLREGKGGRRLMWHLAHLHPRVPRQMPGRGPSHAGQAPAMQARPQLCRPLQPKGSGVAARPGHGWALALYYRL